MPVFIAMIWGAFLRIVPTIAGQVLIALGISVVTYTGIDVTLTWLKAQAIANFTALPPQMLGMLAVMKVGESINILISAMVARMTITGFTSGSFKRWVTR